eukprot:CAMPEP_0178706364 /NCGR_PEP_ID=MMETSP0699-20121125/15365_1 /TAXON_ID=265572 /ORGANISM="Extubocellulus spinifer, Strain CCMP396" /LENGTH=107 /DNA_ID=CAMNT_0020354155 /DNA_START=152 /DNA_END=475 /DNA_ORIENTATION=+
MVSKVLLVVSGTSPALVLIVLLDMPFKDRASKPVVESEEPTVAMHVELQDTVVALDALGKSSSLLGPEYPRTADDDGSTQTDERPRHALLRLLADTRSIVEGDVLCW